MNRIGHHHSSFFNELEPNLNDYSLAVLDLDLSAGQLSALNITDTKDAKALESTIYQQPMLAIVFTKSNCRRHYHISIEGLTGENGDLDMGKDLVGVLKIKVELFMRTNLALRQDSDPLVVDGNFLVRAGSLEKDGGRVVTLEVRGIDFSLQQVTLVTETNDHKVIMVGGTGALGFPSVTHVVTTSRQKKVTTRTIVLITDNNSMTSIAKVGKIDDFTGKRNIK